MNKAAIWARVSTDEQDADNQVLQLTEWAQLRGLEVVKTFRLAESAYTQIPPQIYEVMRDAHRGEYSTLLIWSLDRLSRRGIRETLDLLERLTTAGVHVLSYQEEFTTSTASPEIRELMLAFMAWMAKMESKRLSDRTVAGIERHRAAGGRHGRPKDSLDKTPRKRRSQRV